MVQKSLFGTAFFMIANYLLSCFQDPKYVLQLNKVGYKLISGFLQDITHPTNEYPEAFGWSIREQVENRGYVYEEHKIHTPDGYILTAFRIPSPKNQTDNVVQKQQYPIYMQHGLIDDGGTWFFNNKESCLPFQLVDQGFDVWITNTRGTVHSNQHEKYTTDDEQFWDFTLDQMAQYDLPSNLDYILSQTGASQVIYIGHSQGTTQWFLSNIENQDIHSKFKAFVGVAPVLYAQHMESFLVKTAQYTDLTNIMRTFSDTVLYVPSIGKIGGYLTHFIPRTVWHFVQLIVGYDDTIHVDLVQLPMMSFNDVGGTSTSNMAHWGQMIFSGKLAKFDRGRSGNLRAYNQTKPPLYDASVLKSRLQDVDMLLLYGTRDDMIDKTDFHNLLISLNSSTTNQNNDLEIPRIFEIVKIEDYNHVDYMWAKDSQENVNTPIVKFIEKIVGKQ